MYSLYGGHSVNQGDLMGTGHRSYVIVVGGRAGVSMSGLSKMPIQKQSFEAASPQWPWPWLLHRCHLAQFPQNAPGRSRFLLRPVESSREETTTCLTKPEGNTTQQCRSSNCLLDTEYIVQIDWVLRAIPKEICCFRLRY